MKIQIHADASANGAAAAEFIAQKISEAIAAQGYARICVSTGASQFEMFRTLVTLDVDCAQGVHAAQIVIDSVSPMAFVLN